eukprot:Gb_39993 [translate_table: standard]
MAIPIAKLLNYMMVMQWCTFVLVGYRFQLLKAQDLPGSFVFGDSLVDAGNNNYIFTLSKANIKPNGIDFKPSDGQPTGRYTNGRIIPDIIGDELGQKSYSPPYLAPTTKGKAILHGVNYASGGSGILNDTGRIFVGRLSLEVQINYYEQTRKQLTSMLGAKAAKELVGKSIFSVTMGSNDFINNYLVPFISTAQRAFVSQDAFIDQVITNYRIQLTRLYKLDARRIVVANVGPIGCIPYQRTINRVDETQCAALPNQLAVKFNSRLKDLISELNSNSSGATFVYANSYDIVTDMIKNPEKYGQFRGVIPCGPTSGMCPDHTKYLFWDPYHPSEAANVIVAKRLIDGGPNDVFPVNVRKLIHM